MTQMNGSAGGESAADAAAAGDQAAREWAENLAGDAPSLQDGLDEAAGQVPGGDGELPSDDLSAVSYTESDDLPAADSLDFGEIAESEE